MSRFEAGAALAAVPSAHGAFEEIIARVAEGDAVRRALRCLLPSRTVQIALDQADIGGCVLAPNGGGVSNSTARRHGIDVRNGSGAATLAAVVLGLRRVQQELYHVRRETVPLQGGDRSMARLMLDADAAAFLIHVAAELGREGMPVLAEYVGGRPELAGMADAYRRGVRKGGARIGVAMAFAAAAEDPVFLDRYFRHDGEGPVTGRARGMATRLAAASPAGMAYPERPFAQAVAQFGASASLRVAAAEREVEEAAVPALRSAA